MPPYSDHCKGVDAFGGELEHPDKYDCIFYCGECGHTFNRRFKLCPRCSATLHWRLTWEEYVKKMTIENAKEEASS